MKYLFGLLGLALTTFLARTLKKKLMPVRVVAGVYEQVPAEQMALADREVAETT